MAETTISVELNGELLTFEYQPLPEDFLLWQSQARMAAFDAMRAGSAAGVRVMPAHLPVLATFGSPPFQANLSTRGMGLLPRQDLLDSLTQRLEQARQAAQGLDLAASLPARLEAIGSVYADWANFDPFLLGGLEIFEGQTLANLRIHPLASLLYTGEAPRYPSYQFNGVVTLLSPGDPHYRFLLAARELFAQDAFHVHQVHYPYGYLFHVVEVKNKTPYPRR